MVKTVLKSLESKENIGDHHFFITFITNHKNVDIPKTFHENHPNTMTIVLQHNSGILKLRMIVFLSLYHLMENRKNFQLDTMQ